MAVTEGFDPKSIAEAIRKNVEGFKPTLERGEVGRVIETGDAPAAVVEARGLGQISDEVAPREGEPVITKAYPSSFVGTDLQAQLMALETPFDNQEHEAKVF